MIYENCAKYVHEELKNIYSVEVWKTKKIVICGFNVLSKVIMNWLIKNDIKNFILVDDDRFGKNWGDKKVLKFSAELYQEIDETIIFVATSSKAYNKLIKKLSCKNHVLDFSELQMDKMPNNLIQTEGTIIKDLRESQLEMYEVLKQFADFCDANELRYYLECGTLLGAVRHKGFIPWDDDVDVAMPWPDYLKFCELYKNEDSSDIFFDSMWSNNKDSLPISTLSKLKTKKIVTETCSFPVRLISGMALDIFPLCGYPSNETELETFYERLYHLTDRWKREVVIPYHTEDYSVSLHKSLWNEMLEFSGQYDYEKSDFIGSAYFGYFEDMKYGTRIMPKKWYEHSIELLFEDRYFSCPVGYENVLTNWYGDFMQLPPEEKRIPHDSKKIYRISNYSRYE